MTNAELILAELGPVYLGDYHRHSAVMRRLFPFEVRLGAPETDGYRRIFWMSKVSSLIGKPVLVRFGYPLHLDATWDWYLTDPTPEQGGYPFAFQNETDAMWVKLHLG